MAMIIRSHMLIKYRNSIGIPIKLSAELKMEIKGKFEITRKNVKAVIQASA
jgi:hypothetical protein